VFASRVLFWLPSCIMVMVSTPPPMATSTPSLMM